MVYHQYLFKTRHYCSQCKDGGERRGKVYRGSQTRTGDSLVWPHGPEVSCGSLSEHHYVWCCQFWPRLKCEHSILLALICQFLTLSSSRFPPKSFCFSLSFPLLCLSVIRQQQTDAGISWNAGGNDNPLSRRSETLYIFFPPSDSLIVLWFDGVIFFFLAQIYYSYNWLHFWHFNNCSLPCVDSIIGSS